MNARCTHLTCTPKITADTHTHTPPYRLLTPSIPVEAPRDQRRGRGVASDPSRCDDPALTECQYKAIYKRMKNRPSITGNFSAPLPQEAWPASRKVREGGEKTKRRKRRRGGDHGPMDVITVHCARKLGGGTVIGQGRELVRAIVIVMWGAEKSPWWMWRLDSTCRGEKEKQRQRLMEEGGGSF